MAQLHHEVSLAAGRASAEARERGLRADVPSLRDVQSDFAAWLSHGWKALPRGGAERQSFPAVLGAAVDHAERCGAGAKRAMDDLVANKLSGVPETEQGAAGVGGQILRSRGEAVTPEAARAAFKEEFGKGAPASAAAWRRRAAAAGDVEAVRADVQTLVLAPDAVLTAGTEGTERVELRALKRLRIAQVPEGERERERHVTRLAESVAGGLMGRDREGCGKVKQTGPSSWMGRVSLWRFQIDLRTRRSEEAAQRDVDVVCKLRGSPVLPYFPGAGEYPALAALPLWATIASLKPAADALRPKVKELCERVAEWRAGGRTTERSAAVAAARAEIGALVVRELQARAANAWELHGRPQTL